MSATEHAVSIRGLPDWLIRDYLSDMGATADEADDDAGGATMRAADWSVTWIARRVPVAGSGSLTLTQFDMVFSGEAAAVADATERFLAKAQRGGG